MLIPKINITSKDDFNEIAKKLKDTEKNQIAYPNWTNYSHYPEVEFCIAHDGDNIYLQFNVTEDEVRAVANKNNGEVWKDSCVEFFISFDDSGFYYNLEQSCIGTALLGYRKERKNSQHGPDEVINNIKRKSSLGTENFDLRKGEFNWTLISIIPISTFWENDFKSFDGLEAKANFYKCGDNLSQPHYLSWAPVKVDKPDFHRIEFFQKIKFE